MEIVKIPTDQIKMYGKNAKQHSEAQIEHLKSSIERFGAVDPIGVWGDQNIIVEGHGRYQVLKEMGRAEIECIRLDHLTEDEAKAYRLAHNQINLETGFDFNMLKEELEELDDFPMADFGFNDPKFGTSLAEAVEDDFEVELPEEAKTKTGDVWQMGRHRLICGDSTSWQDTQTLMDGQQVDLVITDPPYNVAIQGHTKDALTIQNDNMSDEEFRKFLTNCFTNVNLTLKAGGSFYIFHAGSTSYEFIGACKDTGWQIRQILVWVKNSMVLGRQSYQNRHEPCLFGWREGAAHIWNSDRKQTTVLEFDRPSRNAEHPTMKPVKLFDYLIQNSTRAGDIVFDPFAGSGTTLIACEQNSRAARCIEIDEKYCDVIINRWEQLTGEKAELVNKETLSCP
jgi:site-specific DNA-methyltransferase (adenine-specific)